MEYVMSGTPDIIFSHTELQKKVSIGTKLH